ncbi:MAG: restriction endonuclease subunit S [Lachnospiraceae bacterium]
MNKKKEIVPKLRFPEFSKSYWGITRLNALAEKITERNKDDKVSRVFTNSAAEGVVDQEEYFDRDIANKNNLTNYFIVEKGDYVYNPRISTAAPVGPISKNKLGIGVMSPLYTVFRFRNEENDFYEYFFLTNLWHTYIKNFSNTGARHDRITISVDNFMKMPLPYTSPAEQQKIADCLSSIDELIDAENRKLEALKKHKKGLMQKLFPAAGKTLPEWRFPEFQNFKEWETVKLGELALYRRGSFPQPYGLPEWYDEKNGMPFIQVFDVDDNMKLKQNTKSKISQLAAQQSVFIPKGTLIITIQGSIGRVAITQYDAYIDRTLLLFEKFFKRIDKTFLAYNLQLLFEIEKQKAPGGIIKTITKQALSEFLTNIPQIEEQQKIAGCLSEVDTMIIGQSNKVEQLKAHKKGLMQGLFPSLEGADV